MLDGTGTIFLRKFEDLELYFLVKKPEKLTIKPIWLAQMGQIWK